MKSSVIITGTDKLFLVTFVADLPLGENSMIKSNTACKALFLLCLIFQFMQAHAQDDRRGVLNTIRSKVGNVGQQQGVPTGQQGTDTIGFVHRDDLADSIHISFRYLDSLKSSRIDSTINDFDKFFAVPSYYITMGNTGAAAYPILFSPILKAGWDAGFHAFDLYRFTLEGTRFFNTTKPYTQLSYLLASGKEQFIKILHTQNIKPNWNFGFEYRIVTSPGLFKTQNTNNNNYRLFSKYIGVKKRYAAWFLLMGNKVTTSENGGVRSDTFLLNPEYNRRFTVPVNLGGDAQFGQDLFSTKISVGNIYRDFTAFYRHSYDLGKKDSIKINDSTWEFLFYPKFRFQHTANFSIYSYQFKDTASTTGNAAALDSAIYKKWYDLTIPAKSGFNFVLKDKWKIITNDFSIKQFPQTKNPAQFIEAGIRLENLFGVFTSGKYNYYNVVLHGEYRNKTKNKKWDALARGEFYSAGMNAADYSMYASLTRFLNSKFGEVQVAFQNVNRSASYIFNGNSSFGFKNQLAGKNENITVISAVSENPKFTLGFRNISIAGYLHFVNYYQAASYANLINVIQVFGSTKFKLSKHLTLYSDAIVQKTGSAAPVKVPLVFTRQRVAFEGVFFKNLNLSTGLDMRYYSPFTAYNYSPVGGQFVSQDTTTIRNLPDIAAYFHFRIKSFTGIVRLENLNSIKYDNGLNFSDNNYAAPHYPTQGLVFRIGVRWGFVN